MKIKEWLETLQDPDDYIIKVWSDDNISWFTGTFEDMPKHIEDKEMQSVDIYAQYDEVFEQTDVIICFKY